HCVHINIRTAAFILLAQLIQHSEMSDNRMDITTKDQNTKNSTNSEEPVRVMNSDKIIPCTSNSTLCKELIPNCITCNFNMSCVYGEELNVSCNVERYAECKGERRFDRNMICRYCYQTEPWEHTCDLKADCHSVSIVNSIYQTNCTVHPDILCLGRRTFNKNIRCNWTRGYRWSTAMALSITLGGFGADRFYLGHWQEGIGKLFSFGGLGVWTLIDVILISLHYLGPADGSLYI
ncbi:hypothetical protein AMK59_8323, partial [Oryctes borbonicus]